MNILVTGGAGFIGSHLVEKLVDLGHQVTVLDNLLEGKLVNLEGINHTFLQGDVLLKLPDFNRYHFDYIFHLACSKMIYSVDDPKHDFEVNALGTFNVLEYARKHDLPVLYTSTGSVYGNPKTYPVYEDQRPDPISPYGVSKLVAELYCKLFTKVYDLETTIARLHSVYGPRQSEIGVIPKFLRQCMKGEPMTIEGDGNQRRTFTYVDDCVKSLILLSDWEGYGKIYNIAGNKETSINDLSAIIALTTMSTGGVKYVERKKGDLDLSHPSIMKMVKLGWYPKTDLPEGLRKTYEWLQNG